MMARKEAVLDRIRRRSKGGQGFPPPGRPESPAAPPGADLAALFAERLGEVAGTCEHVAGPEDVPQALRRHLGQAADGGKVVLARDTAHIGWGREGLDASPENPPAECVAGVTGAVCAIAETGTLVLSSDVPGGMEASLLPERHVCVLERKRIVGDMREAIEVALAGGDGMPGNLVFVTGPSVTADIEQTMVRGAHGPLGVHVMIVG